MSWSALRSTGADAALVALLAVAFAAWPAAPARAECAPPEATDETITGQVSSVERDGDSLLIAVRSNGREVELVARPYPSTSNDGLEVEEGATYRFRAIRQGGGLLVDECSETLVETAAAPAETGGWLPAIVVSAVAATVAAGSVLLLAGRRRRR
jgi:hypothetical protein